MSFVDFHISTIKSVDAIAFDNVIEVKAFMYRGNYQSIANPITGIVESTYVRTEKLGEVLIIFVPNEATEQEINSQLYDLLLSEKEAADEVIPECVY